MTEQRREDLLWSLASQDPREPASPDLTDDRLERYRQGLLEPEEEKELELQLATDRQARQRLAEIAGVRLPEPPAHLRERILEHRPGGTAVAWKGLFKRWRLALAASAVLLLATLPLLRPPGLPADLSFDLEVRGLAETRGPGDGPSPSSPLTEAYPDSRVQVTVEARGRARKDLGFSLYRRDGDLLRRVPTVAPLHLEVSRGTARLTGPATSFLRPSARGSAGTFEFFFVVHLSGDSPPATVEVSDDEPADRLARGQRRRVYGWQLRLLPTSSVEPSLEEEI